MPLCATAMTKVQFDAHLLKGANLTVNDPQVVQVGPPVRVMCGASMGTHKAAIRSFTTQSTPWATFCKGAEIARPTWAAAAGELLFRAEGARVTNRRSWSGGLDLYSRSMQVGCFMDARWVEEGLSLIISELPIIDRLRAGHSSPTNELRAAQ